MSGSRLGRGRGGRLAVYGGCGVVIVLLVLLYRAATSEMARLRELHVQCAHQQEALAAQLQVIFEYKVRLEKSLAEEKSSNVAVKQELQQRASREKSLRDKDSLEATQRFNSLQQSFKLLQTEHQDLQDECNKRQKQALEDTNRLENTLQELRSQIRLAKEDKEHSLEHLKTKYLELEDEKMKLEDKYNSLLKNTGDINSTIEHCKKEVFQLNRELQEAKKEGGDKGSLQFPDQAGSSQLGKPGDPMEQSLRSSQQQQSVQSTSLKVAVISKYDNTSAKPGLNVNSTPDRSSVLLKVPIAKIKLPQGVPPIPKMIDTKGVNDDRNDNQEETKKEDALANAAAKKDQNVENDNKDKGKLLENENQEAQVPAAIRKRLGKEILERQHGNLGWFKIQPGIQEVGEELNNLARMPGQDIVVDQYDEALDYDREPHNNNDHLEEDEGEDEDDQEYQHNLKPEKQD